jgi:hypothetical protein
MRPARPCVVIDEQPISHVLTIAIDRKRLSLRCVEDRERNDFPGIGWTVVVSISTMPEHLNESGRSGSDVRCITGLTQVGSKISVI